jgi:hypothetical protein
MSIVIFGIVIALAAAARSTWSPCGLSMLSQITPLAEAGRGQRYARTASWFVAGATLGGLTLGAATAIAARACAAAGVTHTAALWTVAGCAIAAAAVDARVFGFGPPFVRRQVNEAWLQEFRPWVYGGGFGWQIGAGVTTYVMTAAVPLLVVIGALSRSAAGALALGALFGLARGLAVLLGARLHTQAALFAFHRRFDAWTEPVRRAAISAQVVVAAAAVWLVGPAVVATTVMIAAIALVAATWARSARAQEPEPITV